MHPILRIPRSLLGPWIVVLFCFGHHHPMAFGQFGNGQMPGNGPIKLREEPKPKRVPYYAPVNAKPIVNVVITGRHHVEESRIRALLQTRADRDYDPELVQRDVRELVRSGLFQNVRTYHEDVDGGVIVTFEVTERPVLQYLRFEGHHAKKEKTLKKQISLRTGDPLNRFAIEEARRQLEQYYKKAGFTNARITVAEGLDPQDAGVVFQIYEGTRQRIVRVRFEGNTIVSDARLTTQIQSKPAKFWLLGGNVIPDEMDQDLVRLQAYYRSLGYFGAKINYRQQFDDDQKWLTLTFDIEEGPRYRIRQIRIEGNEIFNEGQLLANTTLRRGEYFNLARLQGDLSCLRDEYGMQGYMFADVAAEPKFFEQPGLLDVVYKVDEGEQYRVGRVIVNIAGDERFTRRNVVLNRLSFRPGDIINLREIRNSERRLMHSNLFLNEPVQGIVPTITVKPPEGEAQIARGRGNPPTVRGQSNGTDSGFPILDVIVDVMFQ